MSKDRLPTEDELNDMIEETFGMPMAEFFALTPEMQAELALSRGVAFACTENMAPLGDDGKPVSSSPGGNKRTRH